MFLEGLQQESLKEIQTLNMIDQSGELVRGQLIKLQTKLNFAAMMYDLPTVIEKIIQDTEAVNAKKQSFVASQEGGRL